MIISPDLGTRLQKPSSCYRIGLKQFPGLHCFFNMPLNGIVARLQLRCVNILPLAPQAESNRSCGQVCAKRPFEQARRATSKVSDITSIADFSVCQSALFRRFDVKSSGNLTSGKTERRKKRNAYYGDCHRHTKYQPHRLVATAQLLHPTHDHHAKPYTKVACGEG